MRKYFVTFIMALFLLTSSMVGLAADRSVLIEPAHGGLDYGYDINGTLEKELNLNLAFDLAKHLDQSTITRTTDKSVSLEDVKKMIEEFGPEVIVTIHHHGKQAAFVEYNPAATRLAYQLGAYFASEDIPFRFLRFKGAYLFAQPEPAILLVVSPEIAEQMDLEFVARLLKGI